MATDNPFRKSASSRYMLALQREGAAVEGERLFTMFFDTFAELRKAVQSNLSRWLASDTPVYVQPLNGFSVASLPAEFVKAQSRRYGRCEIARRSKSGVTQWMAVISLR